MAASTQSVIDGPTLAISVLVSQFGQYISEYLPPLGRIVVRMSLALPHTSHGPYIDMRRVQVCGSSCTLAVPRYMLMMLSSNEHVSGQCNGDNC